MAVFALLTEKQTFFTNNGVLATGYKLFIYLAGTSTKATTYQETDGVTPNANPIVLNSRGEIPAGMYVAHGTYKLVLAPSTDTDPPSSPIWTRDNLTPTNDVMVSNAEWQAAGLTPSYISASSFSLVGDQTGTYTVGRRLKILVTGGTSYCTITASSYGAPNTTVTVDTAGSVALDNGMNSIPSSLSYGLLDPANTSVSADATHQKATAVASAATTNIWAIGGDLVHVTGTAAITSFGTASKAGQRRTIFADGAFTLTNGGNLVLPGGVNIVAQVNDVFTVVADTTTKAVVTAYQRASSVPSALPRNFLAGGATAWVSNTSISVAPGDFRDSTNVQNISLAASITGVLAATWAAGSGANKLDTGALAANTTYHVYAIRKDSDGSGDILFSLSASSPTMPGGYTYFRRIASIVSNGSSQIPKYYQDGGDFYWDTISVDVTNVMGATPTNLTLDNGSVPRVPGGLRVKAHMQAMGNGGVTQTIIFRVYDPQIADVALTSGTPLGTGHVENVSATTAKLSVPCDVWTNTSRQVRGVTDALGKSITIAVIGWFDPRGQ